MLKLRAPSAPHCVLRDLCAVGRSGGRGAAARDAAQYIQAGMLRLRVRANLPGQTVMCAT